MGRPSPFQAPVALAMVLGAVLAGARNLQEPPVRLNQTPGTQFGFSVGLWLSEGQTRLVVGAPEAGTEGSRKVLGEVFLCHYPSLHCSSNRTKLTPKFDDERQNVGLVRGIFKFGYGSTIVTDSRPDAPLLMCAPRSSYYWKLGTDDSVVPEGECVLLPSFSKPSVSLKPDIMNCRPHSEQIQPVLRYCGFSTTLSQNKKHVFVACPDVVAAEEKEQNGCVLTFDAATGQRLTDDTGSSEELLLMDKVCDGWAMTRTASGEVLVTCSRNGMVEELKSGAQVLRTSETIGEQLGATLATCDLNGDALDELLVGAPLGRVAARGETGKVLVLYNEHEDTLAGREQFSRFGASIACLTDLNLDGYFDVAIGAPYHPGGGAVFIYHGSAAGVLKEPSQIIQPSSETNSFGFSLAGGLDVDGNGYPDLLVGAPTTDEAFLYRASPILKLRLVTFDFSNKTVDLGVRNCEEKGWGSGEQWKRRACFTLNLELEARGPTDLLLDNFTAEVEVVVELDVEGTDEGRRRVFFLHQEPNDRLANHTYSLKTSRWTKMYQVYAEELAQPGDKYPFPKAIVQVRVIGAVELTRNMSLVPDMPQLDAHAEFSFSCRNDCVAETDITFTLEDNITFEVGAASVTVNGTLVVAEDSAYSPSLTLVHGAGVRLVEVRVPNSLMTLRCTPAEAPDTHCSNTHNCTNYSCSSSFLKLTSGSEFEVEMVVLPEVEWLLARLGEGEEPQVRAQLQWTVLNYDLHPDDNGAVTTLSPRLRPRLAVFGVSEPELVEVTSWWRPSHDLLQQSVTTWEEGKGEVLRLSCSLTNKGTTRLRHTQIELMWPVKNKTDNSLFSVLRNCTLGAEAGQHNNCSLLLNSTLITPTQGSAGDAEGASGQTVVSCENFECDTYRFDAYDLESEANVTVWVDLVIATAGLQGVGGTVRVESWCRGDLVAPRGPAVELDQAGPGWRRAVVTQMVLPQLPSDESTPSWVVVVSLLLALVILSAIIVILYKHGFFKRKRVPDRAANGDAPQHEGPQEENMHLTVN